MDNGKNYLYVKRSDRHAFFYQDVGSEGIAGGDTPDQSESNVDVTEDFDERLEDVGEEIQFDESSDEIDGQTGT